MDATIVITALVLMCSALASAIITVELDISDTMALPGEKITVLCRMTGGSVSTQVYMYKEVRLHGGTSVRELISTNGFLTSLYSEMDRFRIIVTDTGSAISYSLNINGATEEDGGHYGCYLPEQSDVFDSERLQIYTQSKKLFFTNQINGNSIALEEGKSMFLECRAEEVVPVPELRILFGEVDYTDNCTKGSILEVYCEGRFDQKPVCPLHSHYSAWLSCPDFIPDFIPDVFADGNKITCESSIPESGLEPVRTTLNVDYRYSPKFECDEVMYALVNETQFTFSCLVRYNPEPWNWVWQFTVDGKEYEILPIMHYQTMEYTSRIQEQSEKSSIVEFTIADVYEWHYVSYHLTVYQSVANTTHTITLQQQMSHQSGASPNPVTSSLLVFIYISLQLLWH